MTDGEEANSKASSRRVLGRTTAMLLTAAMIIGTGLFAALGETAENVAVEYSISRADLTPCASQVKRTASMQFAQKSFMSPPDRCLRRGARHSTIRATSRKFSKIDAQDPLKFELNLAAIM